MTDVDEKLKYRERFEESLKKLPRNSSNKIEVADDHTGRWITEYTEDEYRDTFDMSRDEMAWILYTEITKEIDKEIINSIVQHSIQK